MSRVLSHVRARPRLWSALALGVAAAWLLPGGALTRGLVGWNLAVWLYVVLMGLMMLRSDHARLREVAAAQAESAMTVLVLAIIAALVSLAGSAAELAAARPPAGTLRPWSDGLPHVALALSTVVGGWLLLPTLFTLTYASHYFHSRHGRGLLFPGTDASFKPDYGDFLYFSFTIAVASQTADVAVTTQPMRRLVLLQSLLSFAFNTAILAFTINIAAGMF